MGLEVHSFLASAFIDFLLSTLASICVASTNTDNVSIYPHLKHFVCFEANFNY